MRAAHVGIIMEWRLQADDARHAPHAREAFTEFLHTSCKETSDFAAAEIIFGELVCNVVEHAPGPISIGLRLDAQGLVTLEVCDSGPGFTLAASLPASAYTERGRGLYIVSQLGTDLAATNTTQGARVSVVLPVEAEIVRLHLVLEIQSVGDSGHNAQVVL